MTPLAERNPGPVVELGRFLAQDLGPLLDEALVSWDRDFDWDFGPAAELVRRFVQRHALNGFTLMRGSSIIGYAYYVCEETKSLIGDLYAMEEFRNVETENALLGAVLGALRRTPGVRRVEAQSDDALAGAKPRAAVSAMGAGVPARFSLHAARERQPVCSARTSEARDQSMDDEPPGRNRAPDCHRLS
jgi:hypothetical protein